MGELSEGLDERVRALPAAPGVYLFRDAGGRVIYVGKAASLRARVRSYFSRTGDGRPQTHELVPRIADVDVVVTASVKEALLLENQLIKKHKPRFNVRLRDDKQYLALRLDPREAWPRFTETRRFARDGATYFGPYTSSLGMKETLNALQKVFPLRTCSDAGFESYRRQGRPCLEHAIGRCAAPCCGRIDEAAYRELVAGAELFLRGKAGELVKSLRARMDAAAREERFEDAARLRDRVAAIERTVERQAMVSTRMVDRDVFALAREGPALEVQTLHVRQGKLLGGDAFAFRNLPLTDAEALGSFLSQFYAADREVPREVLVSRPIEDGRALEALWREKSEHSVRLLVPSRGERRRLVEMAERNARLALAERARREDATGQALVALAELLGLPRPPARIECYDVSHLGGTLPVASRVAFAEGVPDKNGYRRYKVRDAPPGDDYAALREVLQRRLARLEEEPAPDLLLIDGGKGQLNAARAAADDLGLGALPLASIAKERDDDTSRVRRHGGTKRERIFLPGVKDPLAPSGDHLGLLLLQRIRDESHRFAITYQRELVRKAGTRSILDELPGIGPIKRRAVLRAVGSLERLRGASVEELAAIPKLARADAERIYQFFRAQAAAAEAAPVKPDARPDDPSPQAETEADACAGSSSEADSQR
jgi:excinuclease ABC subunit C